MTTGRVVLTALGTWAALGTIAPVCSRADIIPADRRIEWDPGIPCGQPGFPACGDDRIPLATDVCATIDAAIYGNGTTDATAAIEDALNSAACAGSADGSDLRVVRLPAGTYRTTADIVIRNDGVILRGGGPDETRIVLDDPSESSRVIRVGEWGGWDEDAPVAVTGGLAIGSTALTVADGSAFAAGDLALIDQLDQGNPLIAPAEGDVCWWVTRGDGPTERSLGQVLLIEAVSGNELTLAAPLHHTFEAQYSPELLAVSRPGGPIHYVGIEDLYLSGGYGNNILVNLALYSWVKNVESDIVSGTHIVVTGSHRCVVRDSFVHRARDYNEGGNAYGISLDGQTSDSLVENNSLAHLNIPLVMEVTGGGNVYGYNYVDSALQDSNLDWATSDIRTHCTYPHMELVEGNWIASASPEDVHGTSGWLTFFRNYMMGVHENMVHPVDGHVFTPTSNVVAMNIFGGKQLYMNMVGNVLWRQGVPGDYEGCNNAAYKLSVVTCSPYVPDPDVAATAYRHGSFDYVTNSVIWDPTNGDHDLPDSLYLDSKPAFFEDRPWPFVDPEGDPKVRSLPAKDRFDQQGQPVVLSTSDVTITEGDAGNATATFTVTLSPE